MKPFKQIRESLDICQNCQHDPCICDDSHGFVSESKRMSAAVKLQRAFEREQQKSEASRSRMATAKEQDSALERLKQHMSKPDTMAALKRLKNEEVQQVDEIVKPDVKNDIKTLDPVAFVKKHGVKKGQAKAMAEESSMAEKQAQKQYRNARKDDVPFDPPYTTGKKPSVVPGKHGSGYSTARHLARQAMNKVATKYKTPIKEEGELSRKSQIIKDAAKKGKKKDSFCSDPIISKSEVKM